MLKIKILGGISFYFSILYVQNVLSQDNDEAQIPPFRNGKLVCSNLDCFYKCQDCDGPLENNCLSCNIYSNRIFVKEKQECVCQQEYYESLSGECILDSKIFQDLQVVELNLEQEQLCELGFYMKPISQNEFSCFKCPIRGNISFYCLECIFNPLTWYIRPYCEYYLQSRLKFDDDTFLLKKHDKQYYLIDSYFNLVFYPFIRSYCDETDYCLKVSANHLNKTYYVNSQHSQVLRFYKGFELLYNLISFCLNARLINIECQDCINSKQIFKWDFLECKRVFDSQDIICSQLPKELSNPSPQKNCGSFCSKCYEGLCLGCVDGYFLQTDGTICLKNSIGHCEQAFQIAKDGYVFSSVEALWGLSFDQRNGVVLCEKCEKNYVFVFSIKQCLKMGDNKCNFAVASRIISDEQIFPNEQIAYLNNRPVYTTKQWCLETDAQKIESKLFYYGCYTILGCDLCLQIKKKIWVCLQCELGPSKYCKENELHQVQNCVKWKYLLDFNTFHRSSALKVFALGEQRHYFEAGFLGLAESFDIYEGYEGYEENKKKEIIKQTQCHSTCQECSNDGICLRCKNQVGRPQSLLQNNSQCIECPYNCSLCHPRTDSQVFEINPFFINKNLTKFAAQCLLPYSQIYQNTQSFYDRLLRRFIQCQNWKSCQKQLNLKLNLFCSKSDFELQLKFLNGAQKQQFYLQNILFEEFAKNPFQQVKLMYNKFYNNEFYEVTNKKSIRIIYIEIISLYSQTCRAVDDQVIISNKFSESIFSAICEVNLDFNFQFEMIFEVINYVKFENFSQIFMSNLIYQVSAQSKFSVIFSSFQQIKKVFLSNISIVVRENKYNNNTLLSFINVNEIQIENFQITSNIFFNSSIFKFESGQITQKLNFSNISLANIVFQLSQFIIIQQIEQQNLNFQQIQIESCKFFDSVLFQSKQMQDVGKNINSKLVGLSNFIMQFILIQSTSILFQSKDQKCFMQLQDFNFVQISGFNINQSLINNTKLININYHSSINKFYLQSCQLNNSYIIMNSEISNISKIPELQQQFYFSNLWFQSNIYFGFLGFLTIIKSNQTSNSQTKIFNLNISDNYYQSKQYPIQNFLLNSSLIFIQLDDIYLESTFISRGLGFSEISLVGVKNLTIKHTQIISKLNQKVLYLRNDCIQDYNKDQNVVFNIYSVNELLIDDMNIQNLLTIDSPVIFYRTESTQSQSQFGKILFNRINANNNIILITQSYAQVGIFKVEINRQYNIAIRNCNFSRNILKAIESESTQQSLILNIFAQYSTIELFETYFKSNIALNTRDSIIFIKSKSILVGNCKFVQNNYLSYEILQQFIFWNFENTETLLNEDFQKIFKVDSESGNGIFEFQQLIMKNLSISESRTDLATGFKLISNNISNVLLSNITLSKLETNLIENNINLDGVLLFDSSNSLSFTLLAQQISAETIFLFNYGSLIQILSNANPVNITILNIHASNIFSLFTSLININQQNKSNCKQLVKISEVYYAVNSQGWDNFLQRYLYLKMLNSDYVYVTSQIHSNRTVFQICFGTDISISKIFLAGLIFESAINLHEIRTLIIADIQIFNSVIVKNLINIQQMNNSEKTFNNQQMDIKIIISNLEINNITSQQISQLHCIGYQRLTKLSQCLKNMTAPAHLESLNINIQQQCNLIHANKDIKQNLSLILIQNVQNRNQIFVKNLKFQFINCTNCLQGLLQIQFTHSISKQKLKLMNFFVLSSICGDLSCVYFEKMVDLKEKQENNTQKNSQFNLEQNEILIQNYVCQNNIARNGTCLNINGLKIIIKNSILQQNKASFAGGVLFLSNNSNFIIIEKSIINNNYAIFGGGLYLENQMSLDYHLLQTLIVNNTAFIEGKNIHSSPTLLHFQYGQIENMCIIKRIQIESFIIDQVIFSSSVKLFGFETDYLLFPNGQKISQYKFLDWRSRRYLNPNLNFRIIAMINSAEKFINLQNSFCQIRSGLTQYNQTTSIQYTNNYTSFNIVYFNKETEDYSLDDLVINFPLEIELNDSRTLSLEFQCSFISIPKFNKNYPYNYISQHQNYSIRFFLKPLPCQLGEIRNIDQGICTVCDSEQGFFSLKLKENQCLIKDDISTLQVQPAQLQLRSGFWRPYLDTSIISNCFNIPQNCLGGWIEGDTSCMLGHIGALCEQCDIQNIRGDGKFFETNQYDCQSCEKQINQIILIAFIIIYILITIWISAVSNIQSVKSQLILIKMKILGFRVSFQYNQKSILYKLLTNHLQILGLVSSFQSSFRIEKLTFVLNVTATPSLALTSSFDCLLSEYFSMRIHYIRIMFLLLQPLLFIILIFFIYIAGQLFEKIQFNHLLFSTTMIYIYIYFQPNLVGKLVQLLSYREISTYKWILANVAFRYDDQNHFYLMLYFLIPVLIILALMIPFFFFYSLHSNKKLLDKKQVRLKWGYLYCEYKPETYLWEILRIFKKIILLGFLSYYQSFPLSQVVIAILILLLYLQSSHSFKPYYSNQLNNIDYQSMVACLISIICTTLTSESKILMQYYFQEIILLTLNFRLMKIIFTQLLIQYLQESSPKLKRKLDQIRGYIRKTFPFLYKYKSIWRRLQNQIIKEQRIQNLLQKLKNHLLQQGKEKYQKNVLKLKVQKINDISNQFSFAMKGFQNL